MISNSRPWKLRSWHVDLRLPNGFTLFYLYIGHNPIFGFGNTKGTRKYSIEFIIGRPRKCIWWNLDFGKRQTTGTYPENPRR